MIQKQALVDRGTHWILLPLSMVVLAISQQANAQFPALEWVRASEADNLQVAVGLNVAVDAAGNTYTTGNFRFTVDFDPGPGTFNLTSAGEGDVFVMKLDANGNFVWARAFGGANRDQGLGIDVDNAGNVYVTGFFHDTVDFDPGPGTFELTSAGGSDVFVAKLDTDGEFVWATRTGNSNSSTFAFRDVGRVSVGSSGSVYIIGSFLGTVDFDPGPGFFELSSGTGLAIYLQKLDAAGNFEWAGHMGDRGINIGRGLALDAQDNIYTTGSFRGPIDFDPGPGVVIAEWFGSEDIFVQKLSSSGVHEWVRTFGGVRRTFIRVERSRWTPRAMWS